jgi:hypothetical protein
VNNFERNFVFRGDELEERVALDVLIAASDEDLHELPQLD